MSQPASVPEPLSRLLALWGEIRDLEAAEELLEWDQETSMPAGGVAGRSKVAATLAGLKHARLTAVELQEAVAACADASPPGSVAAAQAAEAGRQVRRAVKIPARLATALAEAKSAGLAAWQEARRRADFATFRPHLARLVELKREEAAALAPEGHLYDAHLDLYEPGATTAGLEPLFADLRRHLAPLVQAVADSGRVVDESPARGRFPAAAQQALGRFVAESMGFDFSRGRLDESAHPFCIGINPGDVRMTWRYQEDDFRPAFFGIVHETGHALYEQGLPLEWQRTPIGGAVSLGVHESQSRLWENMVARSRAFWQWALPHFQRHFPQAGDLTVDRLWPALHTARPSLIRVEADEATYNLHIVIRFEIERALFAGELEVDDVPERWNHLYQDLLGLTPPDAAQGVLQDIHWAMGGFGYFPTYTLGTLASAQLFAAAEGELGELDAALAAGELAPLLGWLREKVHRHGSRYPAPRLMEQATGAPLGAADFLTYLRRVTEEAYGLTLPTA